METPTPTPRVPPAPTPESTQVTLYEGSAPPKPTVVNAEPATPTVAQSPTKAAIVAFAHSAYITAGALATGLTVDAFANGAHTPSQFGGYFRDHALAWIIANIVAPTYRGFVAQRNAKAQQQ